MEFGCHTWGFNDRPLSHALGTIARLGFRYVDLGSGPHIDVVYAADKPDKAAAAIRDDLHRYNLRLSDLYLMLPRISVADDERREHEIRSFEALLPFAAALHPPGITVSPGISGQGEPDVVMERVAGVLRRFVKAASEHKLPLSIEPHMDSIAQTPQAARQLIDAVPGLQITLDWSQMVTQGLKPDAALNLLPYVRHVQVRQAAPLRLQTPFDQGVLNLERVMTLLLSADYRDVLTVEIMQTVGWHGAARLDTLPEAVQLRDALRELRDRLRAR